MPHLLIDPPNGHAYGFPKPFQGDIDALDLNAWLGENGYPQDWITLFPDGVPCRLIGDDGGDRSAPTRSP